MARILITPDYLVPGDDVDTLLRKHGHETVHPPHVRNRDPAERRELFRGIDGAIVGNEPVTEEVLAGAERLKILARSGVGYDAVDVQAAARRGIRVCNAPATNHHSVVELALGLMIMMARNLAAVTDAVDDGGWPREAGHELYESTLGIVGYGYTGRAMARAGAALGMKIMVCTSRPDPDDAAIRFDSLENVVRNADYLSLHTKATPSGTPVIDAAHLQLMKPTAVLVNTSRGSLVDETALISALQEQSIAGAALDVLAEEPISADNPLRHLDNALVTSHLAGQTVEARTRSGLVAAQAVIDVLDGREPQHPVDRD